METSTQHHASQGVEKKHKKLACKRCRHRKQKCDNEHPKCGNCTKSGEECLPTKRAASKTDFPARYVVALEAHVAKLEAKLLSLQPDEGDTLETIQSRPQRPGPVVLTGQRSSSKLSSRSSRASECGEDSQDDAVSAESLQLRKASNKQGKRRDEAEPAAETLLEPHARVDMQNDIRSVNSAFAMLYSPWNELSHSTMPLSPGRAAEDDYEEAQSRILTAEPVGRVFANAYFETIQPQYPFLHRATWNLWWTGWMDDEMNGINNPAREWRGFFVNMIYSIGSFLLQDNLTEDIPSSTAYHDLATSKYLHCVFQHPSRELHVQALLLLSIHALQSSSNNVLVLSQLVNSCMQYCISNNFHQTSAAVERISLLDEETRERIFWSAYALECAVCTSLDLPTSLPEELIGTPMFESIDDERLDINGNYPCSYRDGLTASAHLYRLRMVQSGILSKHIVSGDVHPGHVQMNVQWMYDTHTTVNSWRRQVPQQADNSVNSPMSAHCLEFEAMHTLLLLYRPHKIYLETEGCEIGERAIKASAAVCLAFKRYGLGRSTCQPWARILPYFQAGITLLYVLAMTPKNRRTPLYDDPVILRSIRACSDIINAACEKWTEAETYREVFTILTSIAQNTLTKISPAATGKLEASTARLIRGGANRWVVSMLHALTLHISASHSRRSFKVSKHTHDNKPRKSSISCSPRTLVSPNTFSAFQPPPHLYSSTEAFGDLSKFDWNTFVVSTLGTPVDDPTPPTTRDGSFDGGADHSMEELGPNLSADPCEDMFPPLTSLDSVGGMENWATY